MDVRRVTLAAAMSFISACCLAGCVLAPAVSSAFHRDGPTTTPEPRNFTSKPQPSRTPLMPDQSVSPSSVPSEDGSMLPDDSQYANGSGGADSAPDGGDADAGAPSGSAPDSGSGSGGSADSVEKSTPKQQSPNPAPAPEPSEEEPPSQPMDAPTDDISTPSNVRPGGSGGFENWPNGTSGFGSSQYADPSATN